MTVAHWWCCIPVWPRRFVLLDPPIVLAALALSSPGSRLCAPLSPGLRPGSLPLAMRTRADVLGLTATHT